jgi:uncharacterized protein (DUF427 family)
VLDSSRAHYVWEWPYYPQYYIPVDDVADGLLIDDGTSHGTTRGTARIHTLRVGDVERPGAARQFGDDAAGGLANTVRFEWDAMDAWYEEDEQVFVHPRNPYSRVDALRSTRHIRVTLEGVLLAESSAAVFVFETGLPTRYYLDRTCIDFTHLVHTDTESKCPYKGVTSDYWSVQIGETTYPDLTWSYNFPTAALLPITGLVAFYNEKVDIAVDGVELPRPRTHFS